MGCRTVLLYICLALQLMGEQAQASKDRREEAGSADLLSHRQYEHLQKQLGAVRDVSRRYWHLLACQLWQEGCEEEEEGRTQREEEEEGSRGILEQHDWKLPMVTELVSTWYCGFGRCCPTGDCRVVNNITGLELVLSKRLHGQHLAKEIVLKAVQGFLETPQPKKALTLSFHGWSGTGKNFVARLMAEHLYRDGLKSDCVKIFISGLHFPHPNYLDLYKVQLTKQITETAQLCEQSLFIFDEAERFHPDILKVLKPYVGHSCNTDKVHYRRSIFIFLSNTGGNIINKVALDSWQAGQAREEITLEHLEQVLRRELLDAPDADNCLLQENLIDFLVPFLPLEYHHVKLCARDAFLARDLQFTEEMLDEVARTIFTPKKLFSAQGCKSISQRINYFLL
ncbi:torsin-3A [Protobothrops mucrosquamatus]|uniref:torsin-3A n=1 Tax=Protobothrops mucrosquamatus TaxID=103944 RepID=UPI0010FB7775|nr:torsin-3A [Protobothrops mucrosquamatus]